MSRLVPQKGVHLLRSAIFRTLERGGQFILQGTSQVPAIKVDDKLRVFLFLFHDVHCILYMHEDSLILNYWLSGGLQKEFDELAVKFERHPHVRLVLRCEETLTHNIFAAADIFVIPSIFEPCGLTQVSSVEHRNLFSTS